eukprot:scaffold4614_cov74-Phaeocystis_antarctica.AAC.1
MQPNYLTWATLVPILPRAQPINGARKRGQVLGSRLRAAGPLLSPLTGVVVEARIAPHAERLQLGVGLGWQPAHIAPEVEAPLEVTRRIGIPRKVELAEPAHDGVESLGHIPLHRCLHRRLDRISLARDRRSRAHPAHLQRERRGLWERVRCQSAHRLGRRLR